MPDHTQQKLHDQTVAFMNFYLNLFFFFIVTFALHLNVKNLQSPGSLYITWENKKWVKNLI